MHELAVTEKILEIAVDSAIQNKASKISQISIVLGELTSISSDSIQFYFDSLSRDTPASGASLVFISRPVQIQCDSCKIIFKFDNYSLVCPACGSTKTSIISGKEFYIESIEVN